MIVVRPEGGLCNYLRVIFSWLLYTRSKNERLIVLWKVTDACPGWYLDYFNPIKGVNFIKNDFEEYKELITYKGCGWHKDYNPYKVFIYSDLKLRPHMREIIRERMAEMDNKYIAVHIRRTDHVWLAKKNNCFTPDEDFMKFIRDSKGMNNLYIATDNPGTYDKFSRIFRWKKINKYHDCCTASLRKTSMQDSIIDIYMCVGADKFKGSGYSSFSDLIYHLRSQEDPVD